MRALFDALHPWGSMGLSLKAATTCLPAERGSRENEAKQSIRIAPKAEFDALKRDGAEVESAAPSVRSASAALNFSSRGFSSPTRTGWSERVR
jgi:hypothetical protein